MSRRRLRRGDEGAEINIAPLVDIVFILLIFFMVSTTFVRDLEVDFERPQAKSAQVAELRSVRVTLSRDGELRVDDQPVNSWMLQSRVRQLIRTGRSRQVLVVADQRSDTGKLIKVVDQCKLAGASEVGVAVEKER